jgi:hypothetical protein
MNQLLTMEYRVQVFRSVTDGVERWKAFVVAIPAISAETDSREAVLEEIRRQLADAIATSEISTVSGPVPEKIVEGDGSELDLRLSKMGYRHYASSPTIRARWNSLTKSNDRGNSRQSMNLALSF